ncbi:winged helix-turn-helix domain-containing protein [Oceaniglobus roseus]|uniref:winged helix-turn-helix domain-containing protein n=1 Tax=Oceaniglobus roseus TaxID=1737570 RepID=UPI0015628939|nr:winged helix-turn-helix domain-containing protein [Kandeliimicrobium roseum]
MQFSLILQLLQLSDHRPLGSFARSDLDFADDHAFRDLLNTGVLLERRARDMIDGAAVLRMDGRVVLVPLDPDEDACEIDPEDLRLFEIDHLALAGALRRSIGLHGSQVRAVSRDLIWVGSRLIGGQREAVFLGLKRSVADLLTMLGQTRVNDPAPAITILTPTDWDVPADIPGHYEHHGARIAVLGEMAINGDRILLPAFDLRHGTPPRLIIDRGGHTARLDGERLDLPRREFAVLAALGAEASSDAGCVTHDRLLDAIEHATGTTDRYPDQLTNAVSKLRDVLVDRTLIKTHRGQGYRLNLEPSAISCEG